MTEMTFCWYADHEDGRMARLATMENGIPVNIFAESGSDFDLREDENCCIEIFGVGSADNYYADLEEYNKAGLSFAPVSMIPMGVFPAGGNDVDFTESPHILFTGIVLDAEKDNEAEDDEPNYCVRVKTLDLELIFFCRFDGEISAGGIIHGVAWLYGDIRRCSIS